MSEVQVLNGNQSAAIAAALCRPGIIAAYPITPQTPLVEYLAEFAANGTIDATVSEVESELSAMSVLTVFISGRVPYVYCVVLAGTRAHV